MAERVKKLAGIKDMKAPETPALSGEGALDEVLKSSS
jgi:hypothetical protein